MKRIFQAFLLVLFSISAFGAAQTQTRLLLSSQAVKPGETVWAAFELKMPEGWHTYWRNGGDSGIPTRVDWTLPEGIKAGELLWPPPFKLASAAGSETFLTYTYDDVVVLTVPLTVAPGLLSQRMEIRAKISWQECQEMCLAGRTDLTATLDIGKTNIASPDAVFIESWRKKAPLAPKIPPARIFWTADAAADDTRPILIEWEAKADAPDFFPYVDKGYEVQSATEVSRDKPGRIQITKVVKKISGNWPESIKGLLIDTNHPEAAIEVELPFVGRARESDMAAAAAKPGADAPDKEEPQGLIQIFFFAFIGGLILNVMPCVLPIIFLKILSFVSHTRQEPARLRNMGLVYGLGILVSFSALAIFCIVVHKFGGIADWGSAFRNPQFRIFITVAILLVTLNLFGLFEVTLSGKAMGGANKLASKQGYTGAFFNGVLATALATPCTAPFLSPAIAYAFTQPAFITLSIFLSAGLGLALPFVIICWRPWLLVFFPKPGVWMEQFKIGVGFAALATTVWLFTYTARRMGTDAVLWFGLFLVLVAFVAWLWGQFVQRSSKFSPVIGVMLAIAVLFGYGYILEGKLNWRHYTSAPKETIDWQTWSPDAVAKALREGHPVLVDFTADLCLNCKLNKVRSLEIPQTREKLKAIGAVSFVADYTDESPAIARELVRHKRSGVPLVLVYPGIPNAEPAVLPTLFSPADILTQLERAAKKTRAASGGK